mmetsp:Transcript_12229/g.39252  ORF Transcript_12229/g.39252 Transcript_12229/m.39252 type:complete len:98 (+) Transcript_12229:305-598(+)
MISGTSTNAQEIKIPTKHTDANVSNLFIDFTGSHIIISLTNGENWYCSMTSKVPRKLTKWNALVCLLSCFTQLIVCYSHSLLRRLLSILLVTQDQLM